MGTAIFVLFLSFHFQLKRETQGTIKHHWKLNCMQLTNLARQFRKKVQKSQILALTELNIFAFDNDF